jgi:hypothetical protein
MIGSNSFYGITKFYIDKSVQEISIINPWEIGFWFFLWYCAVLVYHLLQFDGNIVVVSVEATSKSK